LDLRVTEHGSQTRVATVAGEIDALTAPQLATFLTAQLTAAQRVVVDLDGVQFLGSAGLAVLFQASELDAQQDRDLRFVCNSRPANRALEITGLRQNLPFADTVPAALGRVP
jgi:anti-sigma B factor antagonist